jgi:hypothetical protein
MNYIILGLNEDSLNKNLGQTKFILSKIKDAYEQTCKEYTLLIGNKCFKDASFSFSSQIPNTINIDSMPTFTDPYREKFMNEKNRKKLKETFKKTGTAIESEDKIKLIPKSYSEEPTKENRTISFYCCGAHTEITISSENSEESYTTKEHTEQIFKKDLEFSQKNRAKIIVPGSFNSFAVIEEDEETENYIIRFMKNQTKEKNMYSVSLDDQVRLNALFEKALDINEIENYMSNIEGYQKATTNLKKLKHIYKETKLAERINKRHQKKVENAAWSLIKSDKTKSNAVRYEISEGAKEACLYYEHLQTVEGKLGLYLQLLEENKDQTEQIKNASKAIKSRITKLNSIMEEDKESKLTYHEKTWLNPFTNQKEYIERVLEIDNDFGLSAIQLENNLSAFTDNQ